MRQIPEDPWRLGIGILSFISSFFFDENQFPPINAERDVHTELFSEEENLRIISSDCKTFAR